MARVLPTEEDSSAGAKKAIGAVGEKSISQDGNKADRDNNGTVATEGNNLSKNNDSHHENSDAPDAHFVLEDEQTEQTYSKVQLEPPNAATEKQSNQVAPPVKSADTTNTLDRAEAGDALMKRLNPSVKPDDENMDTGPSPNAPEANSMTSRSSKDSEKAPRFSRSLELDKHDGDFRSSSIPNPDEGPNSPNPASSEQRSGSSSHSAKRNGEEESDEEDSVPTMGFALARRGTRGLAHPSKDTAHAKGVPSNSTQAPFMAHPAGSKAAEFLERQERRVHDVRAKKEKVGKLLKLVMDHDPAISGSPLPDVDKIFPTGRSDKLQRDVYFM